MGHTNSSHRRASTSSLSSPITIFEQHHTTTTATITKPPMFTSSSSSISSTITLIKYQSLLGLSEADARLFIKENDVYWNIDNRIEMIQVIEKDGQAIKEVVNDDIPVANRIRVIIRHDVISEIISFDTPWIVDR